MHTSSALPATAGCPPCEASAQPARRRIGIVILHGKSGSPARQVAELASSLEQKGNLVANIEMPWSHRRHYDVSASAAEKEIEAALASLRVKGAEILFLAGHSQGGAFAFHFCAGHAVDGVIAMAPGGNVGSPNFRATLGESVALARKLVAEGKGNEKTSLMDYEGTKGLFPVVCAPSDYLSWFDPEGAMNQMRAVQNVPRQVPVLYIAPKRDYPLLLQVKESMFNALPRHPLTKLYEPDSTHRDAPAASIEEIARWISEVAEKIPS
jgi:pimeloyl-ACP methyl ester carboxylesterase